MMVNMVKAPFDVSLHEPLDPCKILLYIIGALYGSSVWGGTRALHAHTIHSLTVCSGGHIALLGLYFLVCGQIKFGVIQIAIEPLILVIVIACFKTETFQYIFETSHGYQIINRANAGGKYQGTWHTAQATWLTIVRRLGPVPTLPQTGY